MKIKSKVKDYSLGMLDGLLARKKEIFSGLRYNRLFYFVDRNFFNLYRKKVERFIGTDFCRIIPAQETNKSYEALKEYYRALIDARFMRSDILITFGGGILQDISGFIASTLYRGVRWIFLPTTLLAQADSCIGSKTSINFGESKNLIGTFYPPDRIYIDTSFCRTLKEEYFNSGLGEIIKFHLMAGEREYALLKKYLSYTDLGNNPYFKKIILSTLMIKKSYFGKDEFDKGKRNLLNYGHCFGHALESASNFRVSHGEAVMVGMGFANLVSLKRGIISRGQYQEFERLLNRYYPRFALRDIPVGKIIKYMSRDKKRIGKGLTMILTASLGRQFKYDDIKESEIRATYRDFLKIYPGFGKRIR